MKITIGIPFYNAGRYLASSIRSVLGQTYSGFELILSDDGSTDGSLQIAESFNDPRIRLVSDGANRGIAYRLNEQISLANGTFFARMDADDLMFPDRIEKQLSFLERYGYDVTGTQAVVIDHNNEVMGLRTTTIPKSRGELFTAIPFTHPTVMGKTGWFRKYMYTGGADGFEDWDLWIRSFSESAFALIDEPLLFYRDPRKMNVTTYLSRLRRGRETFRRYDREILPAGLKARLLAMSYMKALTYTTASALNINGRLVDRRNSPVESRSKEKYESILNKLSQSK